MEIVWSINQVILVGDITILNTELDFSNCIYEMSVNNNYGKEIKTDFGTFTFKEKDQRYGYIYTCPVNSKDFINKSNVYTLKFTATNIDTNKTDTLKADFYFYKIGFKNNANLKIGNTNFILNGKVEKDILEDSSSNTNAYYYEHNNSLMLFNYSGKVTYSNMGDTFKIEKNGNCNVEVICEDNNTNKETVSLTDSTTDIKLSATNGALPTDTKLTVNKITNGSTYMLVENTLKNITSKLYIYDITLTSNETKIQPNGKVKISIPIPNGIDTSKLAVYRIADNGEKTEYKVTVEGNYATFETDHFSTYVLAETTSTSTNQDNTVAKGKLPQTGIGIGLTVGLIACVVISILVYVNYRRYKDI